LVYGNIVNNGAISHIHQKIEALSREFGDVSFNAEDTLGLHSGIFAEYCHNNFFEKYKLNLLDKYNFDPYILNDYSKISIQVISWFGKDYKKFEGIIPENIHEEDYQSMIRPKIEERKNVVFGNSLFCHYSAETHRDSIDKTDILERYSKLVNEYLRIKNDDLL